MKKCICLFLSAFILLASTPIYISAAFIKPETGIGSVSNTAIVYEDDEIVIIESLSVIAQNTNTSIQPFSSNQTKTVSKTHTIKYKNSTIIGTYTLTGSFSYNGKTSSCTSAVCSTTTSNKNWSFTSSIAKKSKNKALGSFTVKSSSNQTISQTLSLTCSKNGAIS